MDTPTPRELFPCNPEEVRAILALSFPPHPATTFDESELLRLIAYSFSITKEEKEELVQRSAAYSQHQVDEVIRILKEEQTKFSELNKQHAERIAELEQKEYEVQGRKVWTKKNWEGGGDFITAMRSGEVIEIDAEMYDYWLGVLPPVQMGGTLLMPPTGQPREVAFGFAEGWERIVGFWHEDFRRFYCQQSIVTNTRG